MLLDGAGIDRDREAAFVWYGRSAAQGHARAMNLLARCHEEGWGTPCNPAAAREWYRTSAEGGYFRGAFNYASILAGEGNIENAATWFERALRKATEPTRSHIFCLIARHQSQDIREIALTLSPTIT
jgi:TPR repeat protein